LSGFCPCALKRFNNLNFVPLGSKQVHITYSCTHKIQPRIITFDGVSEIRDALKLFVENRIAVHSPMSEGEYSSIRNTLWY